MSPTNQSISSIRELTGELLQYIDCLAYPAFGTLATGRIVHFRVLFPVSAGSFFFYALHFHSKCSDSGF